MNAITSFNGNFRFLSNFWEQLVVLDNCAYPSVEHAYQAAKSLDAAYRTRVMNARTPGEAKRLGKEAALRPDWDTIKVDVMRGLLFQKFRGGFLAGLLLQTDPLPLVEGNTWGDTFWGVCRGEGHNWLGRLLMEQRDLVRARVAVGWST